MNEPSPLNSLREIADSEILRLQIVSAYRRAAEVALAGFMEPSDVTLRIDHLLMLAVDENRPDTVREAFEIIRDDTFRPFISDGIRMMVEDAYQAVPPPLPASAQRPGRMSGIEAVFGDMPVEPFDDDPTVIAPFDPETFA